MFFQRVYYVFQKSKIEKHFLEAIRLARGNEKDVKGIVIDAFSEPMIVDKELFDIIENMRL